MITLTLSVNERVTVNLNPLTFAGKESQVESVTWKVLSGSSTMETSSNGLSASLIASDVPGTTLYLVGANTTVSEPYPWLGFSASDQPAEVIEPNMIYNHISLVVVEKRIDKSHGEATNLGLTTGSPSNKNMIENLPIEEDFPITSSWTSNSSRRRRRHRH